MTNVDPTAGIIDPSDAQIPIPASLNVKTPAQKELYESALEFERSFVNELMQTMQEATDAVGSSDDDSSDSSDDFSGSSSDDPANSTYTSMITDDQTQAIMQSGGLGLAAVMYQSMAPLLGADGTGTSDATTAGAGATQAPATPQNGSVA